MSTEEKREFVKGLEAKRLLDLYDICGQEFNPIDYDMCETYEIIKSEILRRMGVVA